MTMFVISEREHLEHVLIPLIVSVKMRCIKRFVKRAGLTPKRIYITAGDGSYQEVAL